MELNIFETIEPIIKFSVANKITDRVALYPAICSTSKMPNTPSNVLISNDMAIAFFKLHFINFENLNPRIKKVIIKNIQMSGNLICNLKISS